MDDEETEFLPFTGDDLHFHRVGMTERPGRPFSEDDEQGYVEYYQDVRRAFFVQE